MSQNVTKPTIVLFSPHLDDAALSASDHVRRWQSQGYHVVVVTVFTSFGPVVSDDVSHYGGMGSLTPRQFERMRKREDQSAMKALGVTYEYLHFVDAGFRLHNSKLLYKDFFTLFSGRIVKEDALLVKNIQRKMQSFTNAALVLLPLGVGRHVDHWLTRRAAEPLFSSAKKMYYVDFPYALHLRNWNLSHLWQLFFSRKSCLYFSDEKKEILWQYASQMPQLFPRVVRFPEIVLRVGRPVA